MKITPKIIAELERIKLRDGMLLRRRIVKEAKNLKNPLHKAGFTWSIHRAAEEHWLEQAGQLIREVEIYVEFEGKEIQARRFISLSVDRIRGGGYRGLIEVMKNPSMRKMMVEDALADLERFERRYNNLKEFTELFRVSREIRKQLAEKLAAA
jgi:hypothetical protein